MSEYTQNVERAVDLFAEEMGSGVVSTPVLREVLGAIIREAEERGRAEGHIVIQANRPKPPPDSPAERRAVLLKVAGILAQELGGRLPELVASDRGVQAARTLATIEVALTLRDDGIPLHMI